MNTSDFRISPAVIWLFVVADCCIIFSGTFLKIMHKPFPLELFMAAFMFGLFIDVLIISDIYKSNIRNKPFWILSMFMLSGVAQIVYMLRRKQLITDI